MQMLIASSEALCPKRKDRMPRWNLHSQDVIPLDVRDVRDLNFRSDPIPDDLTCVAKSVLACGRQFEGRSFQHCLLGMLVTNNLLPSPASAALRTLPADVHGAFQTGMALDCSSAFNAEVYPPMMQD